MERTKEDFIELMRRKSDSDLLSIIEKNPKDYTEAALMAVQEVLSERGISYTIGCLESQFNSFAEKYYSSSERRFWEYVIDYLALMLLMTAFMFLVVILATLIGIDTESWNDDLFSLAICIPTMFLYYYLPECRWGKTLGKKVLGMRVVDIDGNKPLRSQIALRTLYRFVPCEAISFLFGGWRNDHTLSGNWHDKWSKTYVISEKEVINDRKQSIELHD